MKVWILWGGVMVLLGFLLIWFLNNPDFGVDDPVIKSEERFGMGEVKVLAEELKVQVADSDPARRQGLSGRDSLEPYDGLLLVFGQSGHYGIWMPDMRFSLDLIWIDELAQVVAVTEAVTPESYPEVFYPPEPVAYVLELPAGRAQELGLAAGVELELIY